MTDSKSLSKDRFGKFAQGYVTSETHAKAEELERLVAIAQPQPEWVMLDIATGGGHTALTFAPHIAEVYATDLTPKMLDAARQHITDKGVTNVKFSLMDAENPTFERETFDLITCRIAPHHFPDAFRFVQQSARLLKPGGVLLIQDHVLPDDERAARYVDAFERLRDPSHNRAFPEYEWRGMFLDAGLTVEHTEQLTKQHQFIPWAERQGCSPEVIEKLIVMLVQAPAAVAAWMQPRYATTADATFVDHHLIIAGRKSG